MQPGQLEGAPLLCADDTAGTSICFNPLIRLFAYAQMFNQTIMYDQWLPIGSHTVPGSIRIYQEKKLLVDATGTVEAVKKFPPGLMEIPDTPSQQPPEAAHKVRHVKSVDTTEALYGSIQIAVSVNEKGRVKKAEVVDSDDKQIEGMARKAARGMVFEPQMENGQPVPFDTVLYLTYYPF
jgi:TonB family protein